MTKERGRRPSGVAPRASTGRPLRTLRCMQGMVSGGLLAAVFVAAAGIALLVLVRLFRISRPGGPKARTGA